MPDICDIAQAREEADREAALAVVTRPRPASVTEWCADCGDPIPLARRLALPSAETCIDCQESRERTPR